MRLVPALAALVLLVPPAAAQTVTHSFEGRFGVTYDSGARDGAGATRGVQDGQYTMTIRQPFDNGWYLGLSLSVAAGNFERRGPRQHRDLNRT
jgi:hypothetical protein